LKASASEGKPDDAEAFVFPERRWLPGRHAGNKSPPVLTLDESIQQLVTFLESCRYEQDWLYLTGVGWLTVRSIDGYRATNPKSGAIIESPSRRMPWLSGDPNLQRALDGLPPFEHVYLGGIDRLLEGSDVPDEDVHFDISCLPDLEGLAADIRTAVLRDSRCELPGLGTFEVKERKRVDEGPDGRPVLSSRRRLDFVFSSALKKRIGQRPP
jgi:nucleoid DNA-binding protein